MNDFKISSTAYEKPSDIKISPELEEVQEMMPMSNEDYNRLKESIQTYGKLREHLKGYQDKKTGTLFLLSGWNRLKIASELNFESVPFDVVEGLENETERKKYAISENLDRRQLTTEQKRELVKYFLRLNPEKSDREISTKVGVSHPTVSKLREKEISRGKIYHVEKKDSLGRKVGEKPNKNPVKTPQNEPSKDSKSSPTQDKAERIKELKTEKKRLENLLKEVEQELKKLGA
jgi:hypothetical protein